MVLLLTHPITSQRDASRLQGTVELCSTCHSIIHERKDSFHGHYFCENCGYVSRQILVLHGNKTMEEITVATDTRIDDYPDEPSLKVSDEEIALEVNTFRYRKNRSGIIQREDNKFRRIRWLCERYDRATEGNMKGWRQEQYIDYIGVVNTHFMMTSQQKSRVAHFIKSLGGVKQVHRQCSYEQIITALCINVMKNDGRRITFNDRNSSQIQKQFLEEIGLTEQIYNRIIEKIPVLPIPL